MTGCKETACTTCAHRNVCKLRDDFLKAQKAVDGVTVHLGEGRMKELRYFDYIKTVNLQCTHYCKEMGVTLR